VLFDIPWIDLTAGCYVQAITLEGEMADSTVPVFCKLPYTESRVDTLRLLALAPAHFAHALVSGSCQQQQEGLPARKRLRHDTHADALAASGAADQCVTSAAAKFDQTLRTSGDFGSAPCQALLVGMPIAAQCIQGEMPKQLTLTQLLALSEAVHFLGLPLQRPLTSAPVLSALADQLSLSLVRHAHFFFNWKGMPAQSCHDACLILLGGDIMATH
jgi:hypothetical protein